MTILLTGGTGKTAVPLARLISDKSTHPVILASRRGGKPEELSGSGHTSVHAVKFDWFDRVSWANPFDYADSQKLPKIDGIYLIAPTVWDVEVMNGFIDYAIERGTRRFVFLSASQSESGGPSLGKVHAYIEKVAKEKEIEWAVFRPTWFIGMFPIGYYKFSVSSLGQHTYASENLGEYQVQSIRDEDNFPSVWEDGNVPFVSAEDIARFVYDTLVDGVRLNTDWIIHGPDLYNNDQVCFSMISSNLTQAYRLVLLLSLPLS